MKKVAVIMMLLMVSGFVFAQKYPYQNEEYRQAAVLVSQKQPISAFPNSFFVDVKNPNMSQDDWNLYQETKGAYDSNKDNFNAIMNYAHALMTLAPYDTGLESFPVQNVDLAYKLLKSAQKLQPENMRVYQDLDIILYAKIFDPTDVLVYRNFYAKCTETPEAKHWTKEWLSNFAKRVELKDPDLLAVNFLQASEMAKVLGRMPEADKYATEAKRIEETAVATQRARENVARHLMEILIKAGSGNITGQVSFL